MRKPKGLSLRQAFWFSCTRHLLALGTALTFVRLLRGRDLNPHLEVMSLANYHYSTPLSGILYAHREGLQAQVYSAPSSRSAAS